MNLIKVCLPTHGIGTGFHWWICLKLWINIEKAWVARYRQILSLPEWVPCCLSACGHTNQGTQVKRGWPEGTKDQPDPALYHRSGRNSQKDPQATEHQGGFPPSSHSTPLTGSPQGSCTNGPPNRSGVSDPLLRLPQSLHWSAWQEPEAPVVWTPTGPPEWGCGCVNFCWTHMVHWPPCGPVQGCSCRQPTLCDHTVSPRELGHPTPSRHIELWKGDSAQRVHSTSELAFETYLPF